MPPRKLKRAPLKEVVFEIFWKPVGDPKHDITYDFALGKFHSLISKDFPIVKRILPPGIKIHQQSAYQFWTKQGIFPVVQLGDGVLTVNDTDKNYTWDNFRENIDKVMTALASSYSQIPEITLARLKYLDSVDIDPTVKDLEGFIARNHLVKIKSEYQLPGTFKNMSIVQSRELEDHSILNVSVTNTVNNLSKRDAVVWSCQIERRGSMKKNELIDWLDNSHSILSSLFVQMLDPKYYGQFDQ